MSIVELTKVMTPPTEPVEVQNSLTWAAVESRIGVKLPDDYKGYIDRYGTGYVANYLVIWNPFSSLKTINLVEQAESRLNDMRRARDTYRENFSVQFPPYSIFPEEGGILPVGATVNGHVIYWKTAIKTNDWAIVLNISRSIDFEEHPMNITSFLTKLMREQLGNTVLYGPDFDHTVGFVPISKTK